MVEKINYSIVISAFLVIILLIQESNVLWPGLFFFIVQSFILSGLYLLIKIMKKRRRVALLPVIKQFQVFFGVMFPIWILIAVIGRLGSMTGRIFAIFFFLIFFSLCISLLLRLLTNTDLLDRFN